MPPSLAQAAPPPGRDVELLRAMRTRVDPDDPRALNNLGVLYHTRGLYAEAVEAFDRALRLDPRMRTAARNLDVAAAQPGACDRRLAELEARLAQAPGDRVARLERARLTRARGHRDEARRQLDALLAEDPDDAAALLERGLVEHRQGELHRAQRWLERAVNAGAGTEAALLLAEVRYQRGQNEQALSAVDRVLADHPHLADAHRLRGFVLGDLGHTAAALAAAREAAALDPALESLDGDLLLESDHGRAGAPTPDVPSPTPADASDGANTHYHLGLAFRQRGYFPEARREFERAEAEQEAPWLVSHALAELDLLDGEAMAARSRYRALLDGGETARWWNEYGVASHQAGDVTAAADAYRRALYLDPRDALAFNNLGVALAHRGDMVAAAEAFSRAADLDPSLVLARLNLARATARSGDDPGALARLRELVQFRPHEADAWFTMGVILVRRQRLAEAREAFQSALAQRPGWTDVRVALESLLVDSVAPDSATRASSSPGVGEWHRADLPLALGIALQRECPDAVGAVDLLPAAAGAARDDASAAAPPAAPPAIADDPAARAAVTCDQADAWSRRGRHGEAAACYREAQQLVARDPAPTALWRRAVVGEARSLCLMGRAHQARPLLEPLAASTPDDPEVCALYAAALLAAGEGPPVVRAPLLQVLRRETGSAALLHFAGEIALAMDDRELALAILRRALAVDPTRPSPRVTIARLLREKGEVLAARLELTAALAAAPGWRDAILELAQLESEADRSADARHRLIDYLARVPHDLAALTLLADVLAREGRTDDARIVRDRRRRLELAVGEAPSSVDPRPEPRGRRPRGARAATC